VPVQARDDPQAARRYGTPLTHLKAQARTSTSASSEDVGFTHTDTSALVADGGGCGGRRPGHVRSERDILASASDTTSIVRLYYSFQDKENLYLVMEYMAGGDLLNLLIKMVRGAYWHGRAPTTTPLSVRTDVYAGGSSET
jgi:serine/threonine protein kinase